MKILAITSSPRGRRSLTNRLARAILDGAAESGAKVEKVELCGLRLEFCKACDVCPATGACVHKDDVAALRKKLLAADGLVFASPNYFRTVSAPMKALLDRLADVIHLQSFAGKYACSASTSGGPACELVTDYLGEILLSLGASVVGSAAASVSAGPEALAAAEERARALGRELAEAIASRREYPEQKARHAQTAAYFRSLVERNKDRWTYEHAVWSARA